MAVEADGSCVPMFRLIWPNTVYEFVITDQQRFCMAEQRTLGGLGSKRAFALSEVSATGMLEEPAGLASKLNPLVPANYKTYSLDVQIPGGAPLQLVGVNQDLAVALRR